VRVLIVEDEQELADLIASGLRRAGLAVDTVYDGAAASHQICSGSYDVAIVDRDLPQVSGDELCEQIVRDQPGLRLIMLTASDTLADRVHGLRLGADDYLAKPFEFDELLARVHALGRRARVAAPPVLHRNGIRLDPQRREATLNGARLDLTNKEFGVLEELLRADGAVVSAEHLIEKVWDANLDPFSNVVRVTMVGLRRKLGDRSPIGTVIGVGYKL
jgi:DNA-binding response OmpR family regulator